MPLATLALSSHSVPSRHDTTNGPDKRELARSRSRRRLSAHSLSVFRPLHASLFPPGTKKNRATPFRSAPAAPIITTIVLLLVIVRIVLALLEADVLLLGLLLSTSSTATLASIIIVIVLRPLAP